MYDAKILEILEAELVHSDVGEYVTLKGEPGQNGADGDSGAQNEPDLIPGG
ncbi:MAG: hypothetical protein ACOCO9_00710 [Segatella copri]